MATETQSCSVSSITTNPESCRCGQGARKRECNITSCDNFKKRCKCFQSVKGVSDNCPCLGSEKKNMKRRQKQSTRVIHPKQVKENDHRK